MPGKTDRRKEQRMEGQKDRQTLFYRTLPATAGGLKIPCKYQENIKITILNIKTKNELLAD